jgi:hypothetical protein
MVKSSHLDQELVSHAYVSEMIFKTSHGSMITIPSARRPYQLTV